MKPTVLNKHQSINPATVTPLPRFIRAIEEHRMFIIHTQRPRFIAEAEGLSPDSGRLIYQPIDDLHAWAKTQPEGQEKAIKSLMAATGDFFVSILDEFQKSADSRRQAERQ